VVVVDLPTMMGAGVAGGVAERLKVYADGWRVVIESTKETASSLIAYGRRDDEHVVLKIVRRPGDEWRSGDVLTAFGGHGVVRALEHDDGAVLLERASPGRSLVDVVLEGNDDEATRVLASIIATMSAGAPPTGCPTVELWGRAFDWYLSSDHRLIPREVVVQARETYADLCSTQRNVRLLHGDLQHSNVLFDEGRGWLAIDPKGVIGEIEYEVAPLLRNPTVAAALVTDPVTIERRIGVLHSILGLDRERTLRWALAQMILSAIWCVQDGGPEDAPQGALTVADAIRRILR
jgi:streptomycin 6-kinase